MPSLGNYICADCGKTMKPERYGIIGIEMFDDGKRPYKIWQCDLYKCPSCGHKVLSGFGFSSITEHFQDDFNDVLKSIKENPEKIWVEFI